MTPPSIPARYVTLPAQHTVPAERDGFSSRTARFAAPTADALASSSSAGPAGGRAHASLVSSSASLSNKGYGSGFVSRASRFDSQSFLAAASDRAGLLPGVGAYDVGRAYTATSAAAAAGSFARDPTRDARAHRVPVPSVGFGASVPAHQPQHTATEPISSSSSYRTAGVGSAAAAAAFPSRVPRPPFATTCERFLAPSAASATPGPGHFDLATAPRPVLARSRTAAAASAAFRSAAPRTGALGVPQDVPGPGAYELPLHFARAPPVSTTANHSNQVHSGAAHSGDAGVLAVPRVATALTRGSRARDLSVLSPAFAQRDQDRFGQPLAPRRGATTRATVPAPGYYDPAPSTLAFPPAPPPGAAAAAAQQRGSAVFVSSVPSGVSYVRKSDAPGPASYSADPLAVTAPRSFRLARADTWALG